MNQEPSLKFNIYDLLHLVVKYRKLFIVNFLVVAILSSTVALILPVFYTATTVILPPAGSGMSLPSFLPKNLVGMASNFGLETQSEGIYYSILASRTLKERLIERFDLRNVYEMSDEDYVEDVLDAFDTHMTITTREDDAIAISFEDQEPERAQALTNSCTAEMDRIYRELTSEVAHNNRVFIERRLNDATDSLKAIQEVLAELQETTGAISLPEQLQAMITSVAELKAEQIANDIQLEVMRQSMSPTHPMIAQLSATSREMNAKYEDLISGRESELFINLKDVPQLGRQFADLYREITIQGSLIEFLYPQYESAKIQEQKDTGTIQVIDPAKLPERKTRPVRKFIVLFACLASIIVTLALILFVEYWRDLPQKNSDDWEKVNAILNLLKHKSGKTG